MYFVHTHTAYICRLCVGIHALMCPAGMCIQVHEQMCACSCWGSRLICIPLPLLSTFCIEIGLLLNLETDISLVWGVACSGIPVSPPSFSLRLQVCHHTHLASFVDSGDLNSIQSSHLHAKTLQAELFPSLRMLFYDVMTRLYKLSCPPAWECSAMKSWQDLQAELSPSLRMLFYDVVTRLTSWVVPQPENALLWSQKTHCDYIEATDRNAFPLSFHSAFLSYAIAQDVPASTGRSHDYRCGLLYLDLLFYFWLFAISKIFWVSDRNELPQCMLWYI